MTVTEAARLLELNPDASPAQIETRFVYLRAKQLEKIEGASSSFIKGKHSEMLHQLTTAHDLLLLATEVGTSANPLISDDSARPLPSSQSRRWTSSPFTKATTPSPAPGGDAPRAITVIPVPPPPVTATPKAPETSSAQASANAPEKSKTSLIAIIALLVILCGAGAWWFVRDRAITAERTRLETSLLASHAEATRHWAQLQADASAAEQSLAEIQGKLFNASHLDAPSVAELRARELAQSTFCAWLKPTIAQHPANTLLETLGTTLAAHELTAATQQEADLRAALAEIDETIAARKLSLLTLGRTLSILSEPEGLSYAVLDSYGRAHNGITPGSLEAPWGLAKITVTPPRQEWPEFSREFKIENSGTATLTAVFALASVSISSEPAGLNYVLNNSAGLSRTGTTPANLEAIPTGPLTLTVSRPEWPDIIQTVQIGAEGPNALRAEFTPGTLVINSKPPGASVRHQGNSLGVTPLTLNDLAPGTHRYSVELDGYASVQVSGEVVLQQSTQVLANLEKLMPLTANKPYHVPSIGMLLLPIPADSFIMGSSPAEAGHDSDEARHQVQLTGNFWLGKYEVTQTEWRKVMGISPAYFAGEQLPVEQVSWNDAMEFCRKLTELEHTANRLPPGYHYTLPTEAQWEYACRAGSTTAYGGTGSLEEMGWYKDNSTSETHPVGEKKPNAWGLHDMQGNVWEWCSDWFGFYDQIGTVDPKGPDTGSGRVNRGGGWGSAAASCRSAFRFNSPPDTVVNNLGLRVALTPSRSTSN